MKGVEQTRSSCGSVVLKTTRGLSAVAKTSFVTYLHKWKYLICWNPTFFRSVSAVRAAWAACRVITGAGGFWWAGFGLQLQDWTLCAGWVGGCCNHSVIPEFPHESRLAVCAAGGWETLKETLKGFLEVILGVMLTLLGVRGSCGLGRFILVLGTAM